MVRLIAVCLMFGACMVSFGPAPAQAHEPAPIAERTPSQKALYAVVHTEVGTLKRLTQAFGDAIREYGPDLSQDAKDAHAEAKGLYEESQALHDRQRYRPAYEKAREAFTALEPAIGEMLKKKRAPASLIDAIAEIVGGTETRMGEIEEFVQGHASKEGRDAYNEATAVYLEAKGLWNDGKRRQGFATLGSALKHLDKAVRITWPAAERK